MQASSIPLMTNHRSAVAIQFLLNKGDAGRRPVYHLPLHRTTQMPEMNPEHLSLLVSRTMPYGKYKDRLLADLPGHYLGWFAREGFPKGELGSLIALMYELDHNDLRQLLDPLRSR